MLSMDQGGGGAPKPNKASKKGKKSWRKNVDMKVKPPSSSIIVVITQLTKMISQAVDAALEEARFEERVGGSFAELADDKLFRSNSNGLSHILILNRRYILKCNIVCVQD